MFYEAETLFGDKVIINLDNVNKIDSYNKETHLTFNCSTGVDCMYEMSLDSAEYEKIKTYMLWHNLLKRGT